MPKVQVSVTMNDVENATTSPMRREMTSVLNRDVPSRPLPGFLELSVFAVAEDVDSAGAPEDAVAVPRFFKLALSLICLRITATCRR